METKNVDVLVKEEIKVLIPTNEDVENIEPTITFQDNLKAPLSKGTTVGKITYTIDGTEYSSSLILADNVEKSSFLVILFRIVLIIFILYLVVIILKSFDEKKK